MDRPGQVFDVLAAGEAAAFPFDVLCEGLDAGLEGFCAAPGPCAVLVFASVVRARTTRASFTPSAVSRACCSALSRAQSRRWVASQRPMSSPCRVPPRA
ncbi:hypothetical protein [Streptomyces lavendulae]|uniref:hypothetical protein n=1 Tax=Streptomyces lavendulae TaxID=1914 RepID=UPI0036F178E8